MSRSSAGAHTRACAACVVLLTAGGRSAYGASNQALAQSLFDEAKKLMAENRFAEACPKLAESERLDPSGGTLLHLGICHVGEGKTATAYGELNEAISVARRDGRADRETAAKKQLEALVPKLTKLTIVVGDDARIAGLEVTYDGTPIHDPQWGTPFPVDPGEHVVTASAPGRRKWTTRLRVDGGAVPPAVTIPALPVEASADTNAPPPPSTPATDTAAAPEAPPQPAPSSGSTTRVVGLGLAGLGVVGLAAGGVFELRTLSLADERDAAAAAGDRAGRDDKQASAKSAQLVAMVAGGAGVVALTAGLVLFFTAPRGSGSSGARGLRVVPFASRDAAGLGASGSF